jgi:hypothetical protein
LLTEVENFLEELGAHGDVAALNFVNALEDLLWAFERRATASWIFQLAVKRSIYHDNIFRYLQESLILDISFKIVHNSVGWKCILMHIPNSFARLGGSRIT